MAILPELLAILVCPQCKEPVEANADQTWILCRRCRLRFPVENDTPAMLVDEAQPLEG